MRPKAARSWIAAALAAVAVWGGGAPAPAETKGGMRSVDGTFEARPYRLFLPDGRPPARLLVYLHGMSRDPLKGDAKILARVLRGLRSATRELAVVFPTASRGCAYFKPPRRDRHCWSNDAVDRDLSYVARLVAHLRSEREQLPAGLPDIAGYSNGAYFLGRALQAGKLRGRYRQIGLLAGGAPRPGRFVPARSSRLRVCIEVARDDEKNAPWGRKLAAKLRRLGYGERLSRREVAGGHLYGTGRAAGFLRWYLAGCASSPRPSR